MSSDKRLWAKIDLGYLTNPKMADILDASSIAILMHLASILHCAQHLTDGHVSPKTMQRATGGSDDDTQLLVDQGLWHEPGHDCSECPQPEENRVYVHNYLEHNISSDKVKRQSENAKKAAQARWNKKSKSKAKSDAPRMQDASEAHTPRMQDAMQGAMPDAMLDRLDRLDRLEVNSSDFSDEKPRADVEAILDRLDDHCREHDFKIPARSKANISAARLLLDKDEYSVEQVLWVIDWLTKDDFWPRNIRSMTTLRKQFDRLKNEAQHQYSSRSKQTSTMAPGSERALSTLQLSQQLQQQAELNETQQRMIV